MKHYPLLTSWDFLEKVLDNVLDEYPVLNHPNRDKSDLANKIVDLAHNHYDNEMEIAIDIKKLIDMHNFECEYQINLNEVLKND